MSELSDNPAPQYQHFPASISVLEYNARMRRQDTANANEYWRANFADDDWPLAVTYSEAADEHARAVAMLQLAPEMAAAILAWLEALEWTNGPIPEGDALRRAIEGDTPSRGELLRLGVALRALSRETTTKETR